jgi:HD superfamily phosphohydrolase
MPKWGLTNEQRRLQPWGLAPDLLAPAKTITDPVHGDVYLTKLEVLILDSPPMQRLRRVKQLGSTDFTYPGATHTRFSHTLGTLRAAQDLLDAVVDNRSGPRGPEDSLLDEWEEADQYRLRLAEATVLARLGALLHDICHVPFGHTIEDDLKLLLAHDRNEERFNRLWAQLQDEAREAIEVSHTQVPREADQSTPSLLDELRPLILSKLKDGQGTFETEEEQNLPELYPFVADIVGNTICADLFDYIQRDHHFTGLPLAIGTRFTADFYVRPSTDRKFGRRMVVRIVRNGARRPDIVSEIVKLLRYRYELTERALAHHSKLAADAMIGRLLELWGESLLYEALTRTLGEDDEALSDSRAGDPKWLRSTLEASKPDRLKEADEERKQSLEQLFTTRGDEGILELLMELPDKGDPYDGHRATVRALAAQVLNRQLYKALGRADSPAARSSAHETYQAFGHGPAAKEKLSEIQRRVAAMAGIEPVKLIPWIPDPKMRLKVADVLVDSGHDAVAPLKRIDADAEMITRKHQELWGITVYGEPSLKADTARRKILLSALRDELQVPMTDREGRTVSSLEETLSMILADTLKEPWTEVREAVGSVVEQSYRSQGDIEVPDAHSVLRRAAQTMGTMVPPTFSLDG